MARRPLIAAAALLVTTVCAQAQPSPATAPPRLASSAPVEGPVLPAPAGAPLSPVIASTGAAPPASARGASSVAAAGRPAAASLAGPPRSSPALAQRAQASAARLAPSQPAQPARPAQPAQPAQPAPAPVVAPRVVERPRDERPGKSLNIRIDATVIESRGEQVLSKKTISATVIDGENGSVRSTIIVPVPTLMDPQRKEMQRGTMNMDARARLRDDGRVQVWLTFESQGGRIDLGEGASASDAGIRQSVSVLLDPGKPLVVAQSADVVGDRRLALEVRATVLK